MDALTAAVSIAGAILASGGTVSLIQAITHRRTDRADATARLTDAAMLQVDQLQERVQEAEQAARDARQESDDARRQMAAVRREASELVDRLSSLARWIHDPYMTLDRLRVMVPPNGNHPP